MDIKQDPNSIPNFNGGGRIGELQPSEPEQEQGSVQLDPTADGDGAASGEATTSAHDELRVAGDGSAKAKPGQAPGSARDAGQPDPSMTGAGAIDGLVGAP